MEEMSPEQLATTVKAAMLQAIEGLRAGRVASGGRDAGFDIMLPNGQTFRVQLEER